MHAASTPRVVHSKACRVCKCDPFGVPRAFRNTLREIRVGAGSEAAKERIVDPEPR